MSKRCQVRVKPSLVLLLQTDLKTLLRLYIPYLLAYLLTLSNWKPAAGTSVSKTDAILCFSYLILRDLTLLLVLVVLVLRSLIFLKFVLEKTKVFEVGKNQRCHRFNWK